MTGANGFTLARRSFFKVQKRLFLLQQTMILENTLPKYRHLVDFILEQITTAQLQPNDRLPSIHELSISHGVSNKTTAKALALLKDEGIIRSVHGKGYYVN
jgi:DNA-binding GntR family transcriptional regulator